MSFTPHTPPYHRTQARSQARAIAYQDESSTRLKLLCLFLATLVFCLFPFDVFALTPAILGDLTCEVVRWFAGGLGKALATIVVVATGIQAMLGKITWGIALLVGLGVGTIFGAATIVEALAGFQNGCVPSSLPAS